VNPDCIQGGKNEKKLQNFHQYALYEAKITKGREKMALWSCQIIKEIIKQ